MAKSITVKIGADTKDFLDGLKSIDREIKTTQKTANDLTKSLEYDYDETRAVQAMQQFQKAIELCEQKAEELRAKLKEMEAAGRIDTTDYAKLQLELAKVTSQGAKATEQLEKLENIKIEQRRSMFRSLFIASVRLSRSCSTERQKKTDRASERDA